MRMVAFGGPAPSLPIYAPVLGVFDDALVAATPEEQVFISQRLHERAIDEDIDELQELSLFWILQQNFKSEA